MSYELTNFILYLIFKTNIKVFLLQENNEYNFSYPQNIGIKIT